MTHLFQAIVECFHLYFIATCVGQYLSKKCCSVILFILINYNKSVIVFHNKNCGHEFTRHVNHLNLVCKNYMSNNVSDHAKSIRCDEVNYE